MFALLLLPFAHAAIGVAIVNNTRIEFDIDKRVNPYISNEIALTPGRETSLFDKNKFRLGVRHKASDYIKLDPHIFFQKERSKDWALEYGPTLRLDISF